MKLSRRLPENAIFPGTYRSPRQSMGCASGTDALKSRCIFVQVVSAAFLNCTTISYEDQRYVSEHHFEPPLGRQRYPIGPLNP